MMILTESIPPRRLASEVWLSYAKAGACALLLGAAFGGGLLFGQDDDAEPGPETPKDLLAAADGETSKLEEVQDKLQLAFHKELVGAPHTSPAKGAGEEDLHARKLPAKTAPEAPAEAPLVAKDSEASAGTEPPPPAQEKPAARPPEPADEDDDAPAPADDEELMTDDPKETVEDRTRVARALAKVLGNNAAAPAPGSFALQVASTPSEEGARGLVEKLRAEGHKAVVVKAEIEGKGATYRVRVPGFSSRESAVDYKAKLGGSGFVVAE